ncbi:MAG: hypothetical protein ACXV8Q_08940 [Methylobacter sp.]
MNNKMILICSVTMLSSACEMYHSHKVNFGDLNNETDEKITRYYIPKTYIGLDIKQCKQSNNSGSDNNSPGNSDKGKDVNINLNIANSLATDKSQGRGDNCNGGFAFGFSSEDRNDNKLAYDLTYMGLGNLLNDKDISVKVDENQRLSGSDGKSTPQMTQIIDDLGQISGKAIQLTGAMAKVGALSTIIKIPPSKKENSKDILDDFIKQWVINSKEKDLGSCSLDLHNEALRHGLAVMRKETQKYDTSGLPQSGDPPQITIKNFSNYRNDWQKWLTDNKGKAKTNAQPATANTKLPEQEINAEPIHIVFDPCDIDSLETARTTIRNWVTQSPGISINLFRSSVSYPLCNTLVDGLKKAIGKQANEEYTCDKTANNKNNKKIPYCDIDGLVGYDRASMHIILERSIRYCDHQPSLMDEIIKSNIISMNANITKDFVYTANLPSNLTVYKPSHNILSKSSSNYVFSNGMLTETKAQTDSFVKGFFDTVLAIPNGILGAIGSNQGNKSDSSPQSSGQSSGQGSSSQNGGGQTSSQSSSQSGGSQAGSQNKSTESVSETSCENIPDLTGDTPACVKN